MVKVSGKPKPGVQERILLHLRDYADYKSSVEVPFALSQMGIANAVAIARSNVPRAIASLKDTGLLVERQAHVSGVARKRKAYFLTDGGISLAEETWVRLRAHPVHCIMPNGSTERVDLGTAHTVLPFPMRPVDVVRYMDDNGVLDLRGLSAELVDRDLSKHVEKQLVSSVADLPRLRRFYGRERELDHIVNLLDARASTLLVPGIAGIGKTTVAAKLVEQFTHRRNILYHRCQDWEGARAFLESVAEWLANIGDPTFSDYLAATPVPQASDAARMIVDGLSGAPCLMILDDYHKVTDATLHNVIQGMTLNLIDADELVGLVLFSRSFKPVVAAKDAEGRISSFVLPLDGLDPAATRKLLSGFADLSDEQWLHIHGLSRGHPLVLELINRGAHTDAYHESLEAYVSMEIFSKLSAEQKRVLSAIAVFREAVSLDALAEQSLDLDVLESLVEQGLARQADASTVDVHDLIREFLLRSLDEQQRQDLHRRCVAWYADNHDTPEQAIEYIHHLLECDEHQQAAVMLSTEGRKLVSRGHMEVLTLLERLPMDDIPSLDRARLRQITGEVLALQGRLGASFEVLEHALSDADAQIAAEVRSTLADVALKQGRADEALSMHREALEGFIAIADEQGAARSYNNMGYLLRRKNDTKGALEAYGQVEKILSSSSNPAGLVASRISLARAFLDLGETDRAREHAIASYEATQDQEEGMLHARAQAVLGRYYARMQDRELALHHYSNAVEVMAQGGDVVATVEISMLLGEVHEDAGSVEEATEQYRQALVIAESNDLRMQIGELLSKLGGVTPDKQRRMEYLQRALTVFRELGAQSRMRDVQAQVHAAVMNR
jgi:tetratricopeptide (TPR) repeat protein/DNA-binding MarR family transcriptional regulator